MRIRFLVLVVAGVMPAADFAAGDSDVLDSRVRAYVPPTRVVWTSLNGQAYGNRSEVSNAESLVEAKFGQIPQQAWLRPSGCTLVNNGDPAGILLDFGRELHGGLQIGNGELLHGSKVRIRFGESVGEAMSSIGEKGATNDHAVRDGVYELPHIGALEIGNTGFRFVRIDLVTSGRVTLEYVRAISLMRPMARLGSFRSSDSRLNDVWETSVRTVHLCCQDYLWDGIKRDRLVWMGDAHPEARAILSVFGAAEILPESFDYVAAIHPPETHWMYGMPNYTLWYLRNVHDWYFYTGDETFLRSRRDYLAKTIEHVLKESFGEKAVFMTQGFIDWPTEHNKPAVAAGTRGLLAITLDNSAVMMDVTGDRDLAMRCREAAARVRCENSDPHGAKSAAALLALGGLRGAREMYDSVLGRDGHDGVSTFYGYYVLEAMSAAGENQRALDTVRDYWGAMLDMGATSFWEDFAICWTNNATRIDEIPVVGKKDIHGDFGEFCYPGYRHSLCHGWSSGPAAWCINRVLGIEQVDAGGATVRVNPFLGDLDWAEGSLATAKGVVRVRHEKRPDGTIGTKVDAPKGVEVVTGRPSSLRINSAYPGGNVRIISSDENSGVVELAPDLRDTIGHWFHFDFTVGGAEGKTLLFRFPQDGKPYLSTLGPAISQDGKTWRWLNADGRRHEPDNAFTFAFGPEDHIVRFAMSIPYGQKEWETFTSRWRDDPRVLRGVLCKSQSGMRDVEMLRVPCEANAEFFLVFTARHHACETTGDPPMEGALSELLSESEEGRWARQHAECVFIPFMDKDGVENGDQGKNRSPWDYNRDYAKGRYSSVRALKELILNESKGLKILFLDLHSPYVRSFEDCPEQDEVFTVGTERERLAEAWNRFRKEWANAQRGGALRYSGKFDLKPGHVYWNKMKRAWDSGVLSADEWVRTLPNTVLSTCCEFGYSLCGGVNTREAMQELGANMFKAVVRSVK